MEDLGDCHPCRGTNRGAVDSVLPTPMVVSVTDKQFLLIAFGSMGLMVVLLVVLVLFA